MSDTNPMAKVKLLREPKGRLRFLTEEESEGLVACCAEHLRPMVVTALNTGMRRGEILRLKWEEVDFENRIIYVTDTKNGEQRHIPMNNVLTQTLDALKPMRPTPYVFCKENGRPYIKIARSFETAKRMAGIEDFHFHDLRHTFASRLVMGGVDLVTVKELLGHKTINMTLRYSHLSPDHKRFAVEVLEGNSQKVGTNLAQ